MAQDAATWDRISRSESTLLDRLNETEFHVSEQLNILFPNETSVDTADAIVVHIHEQAEQARLDWQQALRAFHGSAPGSGDIMTRVGGQVETLAAQIREVYASAEHSERAALEMTADVRRLDTAKRNLTTTISMFKRLQMLATASRQLEDAAKFRNHRDVAQLLQATTELFERFAPYDHVRELSDMRMEYEAFQQQLAEEVFHSFTECFNVQGVLTQPDETVKDLCAVADALGPAFCQRLSEWYISIQLREYRTIFCGNEEVASLEAAPRRYTWFKRLLKTIEEGHRDLLPAHWKIEEQLAHTYCRITMEDLRAVLQREASKDVPAMLRALQTTLEFEQHLTRRLTNEDHIRSELIGIDQEVPTSGSTTYVGVISGAFEPFLGSYVESIDKTLSEMIQSYLPEQVPLAEDSDATVLPSSTDLVYFFREALGQCCKFSTGRPLVRLAGLFAKWLTVYANTVLTGKLPRGERKLSEDNSTRIRAAIIILNTADYCQSMAEQLIEKIQEKVDTSLREEITLTEQRDPLLSIIGSAIKVIIREIELQCEPLLQRMLLLPWGTMSQSEAASAYALELCSVTRSTVQSIQQRMLGRRYFRSFCDNFVGSLSEQLEAWIARIRRVSKAGAHQLTADLSVIQSMLLELPVTGESAPDKGVSIIYARLVHENMAKLERPLSLLDEEITSPGAFVSMYSQRVESPSASGLQRVLELKGISRTEQQAFMDIYRKQYNMQESTAIAPAGSPLLRKESGSSSAPSATISPPPSRYGKFRRLVAGMSMKRDATSDRSGDESGGGS